MDTTELQLAIKEKFRLLVLANGGPTACSLSQAGRLQGGPGIRPARALALSPRECSMTTTSFAHGQLRSIVDRIEALEAQKSDLSADLREVYAEAKANGFDTKILRKVISLRKKEAAEREEEQSMLDVYLEALGMLAGTPLGDAAIEREGLRP